MKKTIILRCPECTDILITPAECECGWCTEKKMDTRCAYRFQDQRCLMQGISSNFTSGKAPLYCSYHINHESFPEQAETALQEMLDDFNSFLKKHIESRRSWRDKYLEESLKQYTEDQAQGKPFDYKAAIMSFLKRYKP